MRENVLFSKHMNFRFAITTTVVFFFKKYTMNMKNAEFHVVIEVIEMFCLNERKRKYSVPNANFKIFRFNTF